MRKNKNWFEVSKKGLKTLQAGKPKHYIVRELIQNCWDEDIKICDVSLSYSDTEREAEIRVIDDAVRGFKNLSDTFMLFQPTEKRLNAEKRGRFNIGEKQAIVMAHKAKIITTKGTVIFDKNGRRHTGTKRRIGSEVILWVKMKKKEYNEILDTLDQYISPQNISFTINGQKQDAKEPYQTIEAKLTTEIERDGILKKTLRKTKIFIYEKIQDKAILYEMGIPVCEIDCAFDVSVQQRIPLGIDRETVSQRYLNNIYTEILNITYSEIEKDDSSETWIREAMKNKKIKKEAIKDIVQKRFGDKTCIANSFDPNSVDDAISHGYNVIHGSELSKEEWDRIKENDVIKSSTQLFGKGIATANYIEPNEKMEKVNKLAKKIAKQTLNIEINVSFYKSKATCGADFANNCLSFNVSKLPQSFWDNYKSKEVLDLIIHELGHSCGNHTEANYHKCLTDIASKLIIIALEDPKFF